MEFLIPVLAYSINKVMQQKTVKKYGVEVHGFIKCALMAFFMTLWVLLSAKNNLVFVNIPKTYTYIIIISFFLVITTYMFNKILEKEEIYSLNILIKASIIVVFFIDVFLNEIEFNILLFFAVTVFMVSIFIIKDFRIYKFKNIKFIITIFIIRIIEPYFRKNILRMLLVNKETLIIITNLIVALFFAYKFKPKINKTIIKEYIFQAIACLIAVFSFINILEKHGVFYFKLFKGLTLFTIPILAMVFLKTKISKRKILGIILATISFILISISI